MAENGRLIELMADLLIKQDQLIEEIKNVKTEVSGVKNEMIKLNFQTVENTRAIFKLADKVEQIAELDKRVKELEKVVFK